MSIENAGLPYTTVGLLEPASIAGLRLRNRMVRAATHEKLADENGAVTPELLDMYQTLAEGGSGLIITGGAIVHPSGRTLRQMVSAHADSFSGGLARLADAVHSSGGLLALQLFHGGRHCSPKVINFDRPLAPTALHDASTDTQPRAMEGAEVWDMVDAFASAAFRARAAGFDAIELQAAHGYLISSFLSPRTNLRDDYWGGDEERRSHFAEEILKAIREEVGTNFPIIVKLNADDHMPGGIAPEEAARIALKVELAGADAIEVTGGTRESDPPILRKKISSDRADRADRANRADKAEEPDEPNEPNEAEGKEGYYRAAGRLFKKTLSIPVILTGGFRTRAAMEDALAKGEADLIGLSRPLICEPDLPRLFMDCAPDSYCTSCNKCARFSRIDSVRCFEKF